MAPSPEYPVGSLVIHKRNELTGIVVRAYADMDIDTLKRIEIRDIIWSNGCLSSCAPRLLSLAGDAVMRNDSTGL